MKKSIRLILTFLVFGGYFYTSQAQMVNAFKGRKTRILFLLDASGSMLAQMDQSNRWSVAVTFISNMVDSLRAVPDVEVGLRVFGHTQPNDKRDCHDTKLEVPFSAFNHKEFQKRIKQIKPLGYTSITQSLLATESDFPQDKTARNIIIIITDGVEECNGDPCQVSELLQRKGIILKPFIVGMGTDSEAFRKQYLCAGKYYNAETASEFNKIMGVIVNQSLNNTSVQFNLLDEAGMPRESDIPITLFDADNGQMVEHFVHTMNGKGIPDTLYLDPLRKYNMLVHTLPPLSKNNIEIIPGIHNTVALPTPRGDLQLKIGGITSYRSLGAVVIPSPGYKAPNGESIDPNIINHQLFNSSKKYITGSYDVEILSTPRIRFNGVTIRQNKTTTLEIPSPGMLQLSLSRDIAGAVFVKRENQKLEWVMDLPLGSGKHNLVMQPGVYQVIYRPKSETRTLYTKNKEFKITTGTNTMLTL